MLRFVRLTGGALGVIVALSLASFDAAAGGFFAPSIEGRVILLAWAAAWMVLGYSLLPYLTITPALWLANSVTRLSAGEFVGAFVGLAVGLLLGVLLSLPLSNFPDPFRWILPLTVSIVMGLGTMGLTLAKRKDLWAAAISSGLVSGREPAAEAG